MLCTKTCPFQPPFLVMTALKIKYKLYLIFIVTFTDIYIKNANM